MVATRTLQTQEKDLEREQCMSKRMVQRLIICVGMCLLYGASPANPGTRLPSVREGVVHATWVDQHACIGGTNPVYIRIEPNLSQHIQVGFFETSAGAIRQQWRTAGWMAALVATTLLGQDLYSQRISYTLDRPIEGPSAGGLTTCGLLALMRGETIPQHVSMTGSINPDGTIGPVGGIAFKLKGAQDAKKTRFAVPLGQRHQRNVCTHKEEDLITLGQSLGIEVAEVGDVREAYTFLTGIPLPAAAPRPVSMAIPDDIRRAYRQLFAQWEGRYQTARRIVASAQSWELPEDLEKFWRHAVKLAATGHDELKAGHEPAAFNRIWMAVLNAEFVARGVLGMRTIQTRGLPALHALTQGEIAQVRQYVASHTKAFQGISVSTPVDAGAVGIMGANMAVALAFLAQADESLSRSIELSRSQHPQDRFDAGLRSFEALGHASVAGPLVDAAVATKGWLGRGGSPLSRAGRASLSAYDLYRSTALSNLEYVDALYTARQAERKKHDINTARQEQRSSDPHYLAARGALEQAGKLPAYFGEGEAGLLAVLGALMRTVSSSSGLVAKYYALSARLDEQGRVTGFGNEPALQHMTKMAEQEALRTVGEADAATAGASTLMLGTMLDAARGNRDINVSAEDRLMALMLFWDATLTARLMTQLATGR
jgi:hypothetical protein